ncbi:MAG: hypothetical protein FWE06_05880, partial [Oscillospiraceae bacterium]|nr:hypothetical protein [Oscillospiraceae bacterium]
MRFAIGTKTKPTIIIEDAANSNAHTLMILSSPVPGLALNSFVSGSVDESAVVGVFVGDGSLGGGSLGGGSLGGGSLGGGSLGGGSLGGGSLGGGSLGGG